jgi:preprotein translocase subunit YajC
MKMKQSYSSVSYGPIVTTILVVLMIAVTVFFYFQLRSLDKRMTALEPQIVDSIQKTDAVVNLINTSLQAQKK